MGQTQTSIENTVSQISETSANAMFRMQMKVGQNVKLKQEIAIKGDYNVVKGVKMRQATMLNADVFQETKTLAELQSSVENAIKQSAAASTAGLTIGGTATGIKTATNLHNLVKTSITADTMQKIAQDVNSAQGISITGSHNLVADINMEQLQDLYVKTAQQALAQTALVAETKNKMEQESSSKVEGMSFGWFWIILIICVIVGGFIFMKFTPPGRILSAMIFGSGEDGISSGDISSGDSTSSTIGRTYITGGGDGGFENEYIVSRRAGCPCDVSQ